MLKNLLQDVLALFYPELCLACDAPLRSGEGQCCTDCRTALPYLGYHQQPDGGRDNPLARRFWGKVPVTHTLAYLQFTPRGRVQQLLHRLKYDDQPELGVMLGHWFGGELQATGWADRFDIVVPVPMHPAKERERGYNQATCFGTGLAEELGLQLAPRALQKLAHTGSQTRRSRLERWQNTAAGFGAAQPEELIARRVLLVDDVLTTGATLEACAAAALEAGATEVSVATIAAAGV